MKLMPIEEQPDAAQILWELLAERTSEQSISHKGMPPRDAHEKFVAHYPYRNWYLLEVGSDTVGAIYLTKADEIGISVFESYRGNDYGPQAIKLLMREHGPRRYLANINPANEHSIKMFEKLGFSLIQHTYELSL